jgi:hypothetical protein
MHIKKVRNDMSYRTYINGTQIFGNNESYPEWLYFIKSKGIEVNEDCIYDGYIDDLQGMFNVIDTITRGLINDRHEEVLKGEKDWEGKPYTELTDLSKSMWLAGNVPLLKYNMEMINHAYCFLPYQAYKAVENIIERSDKPYVSEDGREWYCCTYKLKPGMMIHVEAY